jgi:competence protein ComFC
MNICKVCFIQFSSEHFLHTLIDNAHLCLRCYRQLDRVVYHHRTPCRILFEYNDFFREKLFQYKGQGDYVLGSIFLSYDRWMLRLMYRNALLILPPITPNQKFGFGVEGVFQQLGLPMVSPFMKRSDYKQSMQSFSQRKHIRDVITWNPQAPPLLPYPRYVIVDDVVTSGETIRHLGSLLRQHGAKSIEACVLARARKNFQLNSF